MMPTNKATNPRRADVETKTNSPYGRLQEPSPEPSRRYVNGCKTPRIAPHLRDVRSLAAEQNAKNLLPRAPGVDGCRMRLPYGHSSMRPPWHARAPFPPPLALLSALLLVLGSSAACVSDSRCSEYEVDALHIDGAIGVQKYAAAEGTYHRQPSTSVSEEAALYSKRHKTLCQLLWDGRIDHETYERSSATAYDAYEESRRSSRSTPLPQPTYQSLG